MVEAQAPLPVDVVTIWWDYFVDGVGVVSGLATAGAVLIAALTYRQQVKDMRRQLAAKVGIRVTQDPDGASWLEIDNKNDLEVINIDWDIFARGYADRNRFEKRWVGENDRASALDCPLLLLEEERLPQGPVKFLGSVKFEIAGNMWVRHLGSGLAPIKQKDWDKMVRMNRPVDEGLWGE